MRERFAAGAIVDPVCSSHTHAHKSLGLLMVSDARRIIKWKLYSGMLSGARCGKVAAKIQMMSRD
jgi:hypothetical protein